MKAYLTGYPVFSKAMNTQADRVMALLKAKGLTDRQIKPALARACDITYQSVREWFTGDTKTIAATHLKTIAKEWGGSLEWLVDGTGSMGAKSYELESISAWDNNTPIDDDEVEVPFYKEVEFAAGAGTTQALEINGRKIRYGKSSLKAAGVDASNAACAKNRGNSMEPMIQDGAMIGIDRSKTQIIDGEIYALDHDGMLRVKYLYNLPGGGIRLRSYNKEEHPDENYTGDDVQRIRILGWVWTWSPPIRKWKGKN